MIALKGVDARLKAERGKPASLLKNVTFDWERGVLAILGAPNDGTTALMEVLAGALPVRAGTVLVDGKAPTDARLQIAYVPLEPALPDALRVEEVCDLAGQIRGEPAMTVAARLSSLGIEKLANRRVRSLSPGEARAVAMAIAITSRASVLLIEEPLAGLDPAAPSRVVEALRARATAGTAVIVTTASVRDAASLADQLGMLTQGVFTHLPPALAHVGTTGAKLRVVMAADAATDAAPFVAALAQDPAISSVETASFSATRVLHAAVAVIVSGKELLEVARAIGAAASRTGAKIEVIETAVLPLDVIRNRIVAPLPGMLLSRPPPPAPASVANPASIPPAPRAAGASGAPPSMPPGGSA